MTDARLTAMRVTKGFGTGHTAGRAVHDVSLEIAPGELVMIMGPSGSGKTTLLSMLGGLMRPSSGHVTIDGIDLTTLNESELPDVRARKIGFIFQAFNLLSSLTAEENVVFPAQLVAGGIRAARTRASALLQRLRPPGRPPPPPPSPPGGRKPVHPAAPP